MDDQPFNIEALKIILKTQLKIDKKIDQALNGAEALSLIISDFNTNLEQGCRYTSYKVIFMDCQMPFMDGYEATANIR